MSYLLNHKIKQFSVAKFVLAFALLFMGIFAVTTSMAPNDTQAKGVAGDTTVYYTTYSADTCPIPEAVKADYVQILFCGLGKRTTKPSEFVLNVDGYTNLLPVIRDVKAVSQVMLPCGEVATVDRFTENSFAQTSPVPPPYRLFTQSGKIVDSCLF